GGNLRVALEFLSDLISQLLVVRVLVVREHRAVASHLCLLHLRLLYSISCFEVHERKLGLHQMVFDGSVLLQRLTVERWLWRLLILVGLGEEVRLLEFDAPSFGELKQFSS